MESRGHLHKCSLQNCSNTEARKLLGALHLHPKSESAVSINLKKIHVSKLPSQKLLSRGKQKVNLKERSRKVREISKVFKNVFQHYKTGPQILQAKFKTHKDKHNNRVPKF